MCVCVWGGGGLLVRCINWGGGGVGGGGVAGSVTALSLHQAMTSEAGDTGRYACT